MPKILNIVETAYRATIEEQDDTILWLVHSLKNAGSDVSILLRSGAVNYAVRGQNASGLAFGKWSVTKPPKIDEDLSKIIQKGIPVYLVEEDLKERGLAEAPLVEGITKIHCGKIPEIFDRHEKVWHW